MTSKENSEKKHSALVKALRENIQNHEYSSEYWKQSAFYLLDFIRQVADSSSSDRAKLLKPYKSKRENSTLSQNKKPRGRPRKYTYDSEQELLEKFEALKDYYIKTGRFKGKKSTDIGTIRIAVTDGYKKKGSRKTQIKSPEVKSQIKTFQNWIIEAKRARKNNPKK